MATESRLVEFRDMEVKGRDFRGIAAVYDTPWGDKLTQAVGYVETISRGAFRSALDLGENIPLLGAHRRHELLATTEAGTLAVSDSPGGLEVAANLPKNYLGDYYREMMHRGDIKGMSYGMETRSEDSLWTKLNGRQHRSIANVRRILDVTLTWEPAYPATVAELRAAGLVVTPLEEIVGGLEGPPDEAPTVEPPDTNEAEAYNKRLAELSFRGLEQGRYQ